VVKTDITVGSLFNLAVVNGWKKTPFASSTSLTQLLRLLLLAPFLATILQSVKLFIIAVLTVTSGLATLTE